MYKISDYLKQSSVCRTSSVENYYCGGIALNGSPLPEKGLFFYANQSWYNGAIT